MPKIFVLLLLWTPALALADADGDGVDAPADCDDADPLRAPGLPELPGDGVDSNCDGKELCWTDMDEDGTGALPYRLSTVLACAGAGRAPVGGDCNDTNAAISPLADELASDGIDSDCDGLDLCYTDDADGDGWAAGREVALLDLSCAGGALQVGDCDDEDGAVSPDAVELCDDVDNNCDGVVDEVEIRWFLDGDLDDYGSDSVSVLICPGDSFPALGPRAQWVLLAGDCDDGDPSRFPGAVEVCDDRDNDCDGMADDAIPTVRWYVDADADGFGRVSASGSVFAQCPPNNDYGAWSSFNVDCDDTDASIHPLVAQEHKVHPRLADAAVEMSEYDRNPTFVGDGIDQDCDDGDTCYVDLDGDGFGADAEGPGAPPLVVAENVDCDLSFGMASIDGDCADRQSAINPGETERCDGVDQDCDGLADQGDTCADLDGDGVVGADDNCPDLGNVDQADSDADGVGNACDVCPAVAGPDQEDRDGDGVGDACDNCPSFGLSADQTDDDGDGLGDVCDSCPFIANASDSNGDGVLDRQPDADADGVGDVCDICPAVADPEQSDADRDGLGDACDVCPDDADPGQEDADADGVGDGCDLCPDDPDAASDTDGPCASDTDTGEDAGCGAAWGGAYAPASLMAPWSVSWLIFGARRLGRRRR